MPLADPLEKPLLIFDGECKFCRFWIERWRRVTGDRIDYAPFQDTSVTNRFPDLPRHDLEAAVHLIEPGGRVFRGAEAVLRSLAVNPAKRWPLWVYRRVPGAAMVAEWAYRTVARHRGALSRLTRLIAGRDRWG
ncbi:MAG: thiol-disulfide oxidoreductase DCC family protein [Verrucomicrobiia bacterium]